MERVTRKTLHNMVGCINTLTRETYALDIAYGGYRLVKMCEHGGEADCSYRMTAREMFYTLEAIEQILWREREAARMGKTKGEEV